ncbi:MAG: hypothetical protein A3G25_12975 [Betaproteobacteria bacterium RIFCSPLOWO2_12_FULL_63_13]|nr:MAG: hypothetical protein A3G25_12975 [Betaproteobacteria bacterium RIFCSPLOWO2_12_FULL_63_13]
MLYRPPLKPATLVLWVGPAILLLLAFGLLARSRARRRVQTAPVSAVARARAQDLLGTNGIGEQS